MPTGAKLARGGRSRCGLAKVFTKERAIEISSVLNARARTAGHREDLRIRFAGCSSSCSQQQIGDIGIEGVFKRVDEQMVEAMDIRIGGRLGPDPWFGTVLVEKVSHSELNAKLLEVFDLYDTHRHDQESFRAFAARVGDSWWLERLAVPEPVAAGG